MSHKRIPKRKAAIAVGGVAALGAAALLLPNANASQSNGDAATPRTFKTNDISNVASMLATQLGDTYAGSYYDAKQKQLVVNIVGNNSNVVNQIEKAGAVAHQVQNSTSTLQAAAKTLKADATIPGTAWSVDPKTNEIRVTADSTVTGDKWNTVESAVTRISLVFGSTDHAVPGIVASVLRVLAAVCSAAVLFCTWWATAPAFSTWSTALLLLPTTFTTSCLCCAS